MKKNLNLPDLAWEPGNEDEEFQVFSECLISGLTFAIHKEKSRFVYSLWGTSCRFTNPYEYAKSAEAAKKQCESYRRDFIDQSISTAGRYQRMEMR